MTPYHDLIAAKRLTFEARGLGNVPTLNPAMNPHQSHVTEFALRTGCAAMFLDTGLGKTLCALDWGRVVVEFSNKPVLMLAPLAVAAQHEREAVKFGIDAKAIREPDQIDGGRVYITNYERLAKFDPAMFAGVVLDESSVLKSFNGKTTRALIDAFAKTPFRLACTATPAPNDHAELGQHSQFLGAMSQSQMLTRWFLHDSADTGNWRMKGHAVQDFWNWVASWARCVSKPSDLGFSDDGFELPPLNIIRHTVKADRSIDTGHEKDGQARLFRIPDTSATAIHGEKRRTLLARCECIYDVIAGDLDQWKANKSASSVARTRSTRSAVLTTTTRSQATDSLLSGAGSASETIPPSASKKASATPSASTRKTTARSSGTKTAPAPFAADESRAEMAGSTSITATTPARSGASCATGAMSALVTSATTPRSLIVPGTTFSEERTPSWVLWCETNDEQQMLESMFGDLCISITGSMTPEQKETLHDAWLRGDRPVLITKPSIFGFGLNWQHCARVAFVGLSFSYESFYQAVRRCWRFGQTRPVNVHIACADTEESIWNVVSRKAGDHEGMKREMTAAMARVARIVPEQAPYAPTVPLQLPEWIAA